MNEQSKPKSFIEESAATMVAGTTGGEAAVVDVVDAQLEVSEDRRYEVRSLLGRGGMGAVTRCRDQRIGREVAMKVANAATGTQADYQSRFLREARVQAQLEHPAIVPVYDLGKGKDGVTYFTMKRVRGETLEDILHRLREGDAATVEKHSQRRLLTAFASVCLAIDFAHRHGVIHRDLKPANIMLGDFGETYVLDWGIAKIIGAPEGELRGGPLDPMQGSSPATSVGAILGTAGYMAPEQVVASERIDARADVYALGSILFEMLTLEPLHAPEEGAARLRSTMDGVEARPSLRAPEAGVAPELEVIVAKATQQDPANRFESARALHDALERFLDGDRDMELRRQMAEQQAMQAEAVAAEALASENPGPERRKAAMRAVGQALALDPGNQRALRAMVQLLTEPPRELPQEVVDELEHLNEEQVRVGGRTGAVAYASFLLYPAVFFVMGVREWTLVWMCMAGVLATSVTSWSVSRLPKPHSGHSVMVLTVATVVFTFLAGVFGPFILVPGAVAANAFIFSLGNTPEWRNRILGIACIPIVVPALLELVGVLPPSMAFEDGVMKVLPRMVDFPPMATMAFLAITSVATVITGGLAMAPFRKDLDDAQRRIRLTAWSLRQMVPDEVFQQAQQGMRRQEAT
jgi:eukaryotic-like serine/threonine-protein kinase